MKRIIKKSTTITEIIKDDEGNEYITDRKFNVNVSTETNIKISEGLFWLINSEGEINPEIIEKDKYFRAEIAKEAEEYKKKNPLPQTEKELPETSNQKKE